MIASNKPLPLQPIRLPEISTRPVRIRWTIENVSTQDGHRLLIGFTAAVAVVNEPAEHKLLTEVFGNPSALTLAAVTAHFLPSLKSTAAQIAGKDDAESLLGTQAKPRWVDALKSSANEVAFSCGLELLAPFDVEISSPTLQREKLEQMERAAAEKRSADRAGQFTRAAELLRQWDALKTSVPSATPGKLLEQVNPADRGMMLDTLLMAGAGGQTVTDLWAVSGPSLVRIDVKADSPQHKIIPMPATAGPLRSVSLSPDQLLIGARNGVMITDPADPESSAVYCHRDLVSEFGFTGVTLIGDQLWACHRDAGLVGWRVGQLAGPEVVHSPGHLKGEPKHLATSGLFCVGGRLCRINSSLKIEPILETVSPITAILQSDSAVQIVEENGTVTSLDPNTLEKSGEIRTTGRVTGAALLPWLGSSRLLLTRADGPIDCIGLEDQLLTQFTSGQSGMRAVTACAGKVAAMTSDRQRLIIWNPWDGRKIASEIYLTGITKHRIADLRFAQA